MKLLFAFLTALLFVSFTSAQMKGVDGKPSVNFINNAIKNPSAEINALHITKSVTASASRDTDAADAPSWNLQSVTNGAYVEWDLLPLTTEMKSGNCAFSGNVKGNGALWAAQVLDASNNVLSFTQFQNTQGSFVPFSVPYPCADVGARKVRIAQNIAGTADPINVNNLKYGQWDGKTATPPKEFEAKVTDTGVVSGETPHDWLSGNCVYTSSTYTRCTFNSGTFSVAPKCFIQTVSTATSVQDPFLSETVSYVDVYYRRASDSAPVQLPFNLLCKKTGSDYIQPAVTAQNWNFDWKDCPSGFDDNWTNTTVTCKWKRQGGQGYFQYKVLATGTPTGGSIALTLPTGISQDSSRMIQPPGGNYVLPGDVNILDNGSRFFQGTIASLTSTTFTVNALQISPVSNVWESAITPSSPMSWVSGDALTINVNFPVSENGVSWTETWNALQLAGSVTSNSPSAIREEWIVTTSSFCTASPCAIADQSTPGLMSLTRTTTGQYVLNHNMGAGTYCRGPGGAVTTRNSGDTVGVSVFDFNATSAQVHVFLAGVAAFYDARDMMFTCYKKR